MSTRVFLTAVLLLSLAIEAWPQQSNSAVARTYYKKGRECAKAGNIALAVACFTEAIELDSQYADPLYRRARCYEKIGQDDLAIADYRQLLDIMDVSDDLPWLGEPQERRCAMFYVLRGRVHRRYNDNKRAIADFTAALRLYPDLRHVQCERGQAYHDSQQYAQAHRDFEVSYQRDNACPRHFADWAWQLSTCPDETYRDGAKALELATALIESSEHPRYLDVLAAALAECGRFEDAVETVNSAIASLSDDDSILREAMTYRRGLYMRNRPYRE